MIEYVRHGSLFDADVEALVNPVNTVGHMGKGLALQFKKRFKANHAVYVAACERGGVVLGKMLTWEEQTIDGRRMVINFPTKGHWRVGSWLSDIVVGLDDLRRVLVERQVASVALPALGCGLGGLSWGDVKPAIDAALGDLPATRVLVYEPASLLR